jgi:hypothetical protein
VVCAPAAEASKSVTAEAEAIAKILQVIHRPLFTSPSAPIAGAPY